VDYYVGIDVGSLSTEAVIIDARDGLAGYSIIQTGAHSTDAAEEALEKALLEAGLGRDQIRRAWVPVTSSLTPKRLSISVGRTPR
jgi:activator of 2-hydroxyglutaryl-CoA dehydratase